MSDVTAGPRAVGLDALRGRIRRLQEEYVEWRFMRDDMRIRRVELTTELSDYWRQEKGRAAIYSSEIHRPVLL
jgi:hypothetical protein